MKTGKQSDSGMDETKSGDLDTELVLYPEMSVGGLYFSASLSIEDFWSCDVSYPPGLFLLIFKGQNGGWFDGKTSSEIGSG